MEMLDDGDYENSKGDLEKVIFEIVLQLKCKENTSNAISLDLILFKICSSRFKLFKLI